MTAPCEHPDWVSFRTWQLCRLPEPHRSIASRNWARRDAIVATRALTQFAEALIEAFNSIARVYVAAGNQLVQNLRHDGIIR